MIMMLVLSIAHQKSDAMSAFPHHTTENEEKCIDVMFTEETS